MIYPHLGTGLAIALVIALGTGPIASQTKPAIKHAGEIFQKRCTHCHVIPDPAVRTDQGWLDQVNRTA